MHSPSRLPVGWLTLSLLLALAGRRVALADLDGPGLQRLREQRDANAAN